MSVSSDLTAFEPVTAEEIQLILAILSGNNLSLFFEASKSPWQALPTHQPLDA